MSSDKDDDTRPLFMISVAAELTGVHPQTLRSYEAKGLVTPQRTAGNTRMYSKADIERLQLIGDLTDEGINLAGVIRILDLEERLEEKEKRIEELERENRQLEKSVHDYKVKQAINTIVKVDSEPRLHSWGGAGDSSENLADSGSDQDPQGESE